MRRVSKGFTLVEMLVIAPIVILAIGAFITLIVNLTGEVLSSRGSNSLAYNIQDALNRIEEDVKLSAGFLATNSIAFTASNPQGRGAVNSTTNFIASDPTYGQALILTGYVTDGNPISLESGVVYLANQPNDCGDYELYSKNRPMIMNIVYFVDTSGTLWRRTIMPANYATIPAVYCGDAPWQQPSCINDAARHAFCKTNDQKLIENVGTSGFSLQYYTSASSSSPLTVTSSSTTADLQPATTVSASINSTSTIAGREVSRTGVMRVSRLDTNASAVGDLHTPTSAPAAPNVASTVADGHNVTFTWPKVANATSYSFQYQVNGGALSSAVTLDNNSRSYTVTDGWNGDTVQVSVTASNEAGVSGATAASAVIPVWSPLVLKGNWTDYGNGYGTAAYTKTKTGLVLFRGLIKSSTYTSGETVATIPSDYAPDTGQLIFGTASSTGAASRVDVTTSGDVLIVVGAAAWTSLETIRYDLPATATVPYTRTAPTLLNSWVNYGGTFANATYAQDPTSKRVFAQGLVRYGTMTDGTPIFNLPTLLQATESRHMAGASNNWGLIGVSATVHAKNVGTNAYQSLNTIFYPNSTATWTAPTMVNSWVNYGAPFATAGYTRSTGETSSGSTGVVSLKGLIRSGSTTSDTPIFTLPAGYRPKNRILYTTANTGLYARLDILANGEVRFEGSSNTWYSLDNVIFLGEQ